MFFNIYVINTMRSLLLDTSPSMLVTVKILTLTTMYMNALFHSVVELLFKGIGSIL